MLNGYDLIGAFDTFKPKFAKRYGNVVEVAVEAFKAYAADVRSGAFPDDDHTYKMNAEEVAKLKQALASQEEAK
jgi:3-methyl-2-oxobutanoate hydroxymethyltransferase